MNNSQENKKLNDKGFSLVELIIVIAIMAVLVGVLAPQYIKYVNRSRASVDMQLADELRTAMETTYLDPTYSSNLASTGANKADLGSTSDNDNGSFWSEVYGIMGVTDANDLHSQLSLDSSISSEIQYTLVDDKFTIYITGGKYVGEYEITVD